MRRAPAPLPVPRLRLDISHPAKEGLLQALGVFIDTLVICSCTAMIMLLTPEAMTAGLEGMDLLQTAMSYHLGEFGVVFHGGDPVAVQLLHLYRHPLLRQVQHRLPVRDNWASQTAYKLLALVMLFVGGLAAYTFVWDMGDVGVGLMTIFNMIALIPMAGEAVRSLKDYESRKKNL